MNMLFWIAVFVLSILGLIKSSDKLIDAARYIGGYFNIPYFIVGILIVGIGTSMPELASSIFAVLSNVPEVVPANIIGSNIANIFLIIGVSAIVAGKLQITKELIDIDIPLLAISTALFWFLASDGVLDVGDAIFLLAGLMYYMTYTMTHKEKNQDSGITYVKSGLYKEFATLIISVVVLSISAKYLIVSVIELSSVLNISIEKISVIAIAIGTSLPELFVSLYAIKKGESDMALGNIFGSNVFNMLAVGGVSALIAPLPLTGVILSGALVYMLVATALFAISGISRKIHSFEGVFFMIIYVYFIYSLI